MPVILLYQLHERIEQITLAPCDGYVGRKDIHVGQLVQPGLNVETEVKY